MWSKQRVNLPPCSLVSSRNRPGFRPREGERPTHTAGMTPFARTAGKAARYWTFDQVEPLDRRFDIETVEVSELEAVAKLAFPGEELSVAVAKALEVTNKTVKRWIAAGAAPLWAMEELREGQADSSN